MHNRLVYHRHRAYKYVICDYLEIKVQVQSLTLCDFDAEVWSASN